MAKDELGTRELYSSMKQQMAITSALRRHASEELLKKGASITL